jgi:DNA-directed RNA polymerase subunit RPC12/RpoP
MGVGNNMPLNYRVYVCSECGKFLAKSMYESRVLLISCCHCGSEKVVIYINRGYEGCMVVWNDVMV